MVSGTPASGLLSVRHALGVARQISVVQPSIMVSVTSEAAEMSIRTAGDRLQICKF
jgi:hypothetical protein